MWDFLWYTSREQTLSFSQSTLETTEAGVGIEAGAQARAETKT